MGFTIDMDTGGTFTDGFFTFEGQVQKVKVDTTPHDFTECFMNCIQAGADQFGLSLGCIYQNVRAPTKAIRRGKLLAVERRYLLPG